MLIRTERYNEYVNSDEIVRLWTDANGVPTATLRDGHSVRLTANHDLDTIVERTQPIIPAAPGYEALWTVRYDDDENLGVIRHPVLGWRPDQYGGVTPVTLDSETLSSNVSFGGVKYPDGRVVEPAVATYENEGEWFKEAQEFETQRRAGKAA